MSLRRVRVTGGSRVHSCAFNGCYMLTNIELYSGSLTIGAFAFEDCIGLTNIAIPDSIGVIEMSAFSDCVGLQSIIIPKNVRIIETGAFLGCNCTIYCKASSKPSGWSSNWNYSGLKVVWGY